MPKIGERRLGILLVAGSALMLVVYTYLMFFTELDYLLLKLTAEAAVALAAGLLAWVGRTLMEVRPS